MPTRVIAVVDDDEAVRLSTADLLEYIGFEAVLFASGNDLLRSDRLPYFHCILLDLRMPGLDGMEVLRALVALDHVPPVVVITGHGDIPAAVEAMKLGAHDFMEKPYDVDALAAKLDSALSEPRAAKSQAGAATDPRAAERVARLSERQQQVLRGILRGLQNKMIAYELNLSIRTVEAYRAQLMDKLGVHSTAEAVRIAIAAGVEPEQAGGGTPETPGGVIQRDFPSTQGYPG